MNLEEQMWEEAKKAVGIKKNADRCTLEVGKRLEAFQDGAVFGMRLMREAAAKSVATFLVRVEEGPHPSQIIRSILIPGEEE